MSATAQGPPAPAAPTAGTKSAPVRPLLAVLTLLTVLFCGIGLGLHLSRHFRSAGPGRTRMVQAQGRSVPVPRPSLSAASDGDGGTAPLPASVPDVLIDVVDGEGHPVPGVLVLGVRIGERGLPISPGHILEAAGELGVLRGKLPYPDDVVSGQPLPADRSDRKDGRKAAGASAGLSATTDGAGSVRLSGLAPGHLQLLASHEGQSASAEVIVPPHESGPPLHVVLRLQPAPASLTPPEVPETTDEALGTETGTRRPLSGVVLDDRSFPLPGARVEAQVAQVGTAQRGVVTDARGRFTLSGLQKASLTLRVRHPGFAPLSLTLSAGSDAGEDEPLRLQLTPGAGVAGQVRDGHLGSVPDRVQLSVTAGGVKQVVPVGRDGRFQQTGLSAGEAVLQVQAPGYATLRRTVQVPAADRPDGVSVRDVLLEMDLGGTLTGRVRDQGGPSRGMNVRVFDEHGAEVGHALSDSRGEFRITRLPPGHLSAVAGTGTSQATEQVEVRGGAEARVDLEVR